MQKPTLTVCIVARNEENNIQKAIASVKPHAAEIIVVDTGSVDGTVNVAKNMGAKVLHFPWNDDFSAARNFALDHAKGEWVLMLDADEALRDCPTAQVANLLAETGVDAYRTILVNIVKGQASNRIPILRLFRNTPSYRYQGAIHEQIIDSILRANGKISNSPLVIEHYGYTEAEDVRKSRRERNLRLLEREVDRHPDSAYHQFQLGRELSAHQEFGRAEWHLERAIELSAGSVTAARAAHGLVQIRLGRARTEGLWHLASQGQQYDETQVDSHMYCTQVALLQGDYLTAAHELEFIQAADACSYGEVARTPQAVSRLQASVLWSSRSRQEALDVWQQAVAQHPDDEPLANDLVRHRVLAEGLPATLRVAREGQPSAQYLSAVVGALLRVRELDKAAELALLTRRIGYTSAYTLYALAYAGEWLDLDIVPPRQRLMGAIALSTAAVWFERPDILEGTLPQLPPSWRGAFESVFWGRRAPAEVAWAVDWLMVHWADIGCWELLRAAAVSLAHGGGIGRAAWLLWKAGSLGTAIQWALEDPTHPDALEVLGLSAYEKGDYELAAQLLSTRIQSGPARVQVYATATSSFEKIAKHQEATRLRKLGRKVHPWSKLLLGE